MTYHAYKIKNCCYYSIRIVNVNPTATGGIAIATISAHPHISHAIRAYNASRGAFRDIFMGDSGNIVYYAESADLNKANDIYLAGAFAI